MTKRVTKNRAKKADHTKDFSAAAEVLDRAWKMLRKTEPSIPHAVLTFVDARSRRYLSGYFAWSSWKRRRGVSHEVAVCPSLLSNPKKLIGVLLHEAVHGVLSESGDNSGMGSGGYYHTKVFRDLCVEFGLKCEFCNTRYGWTLTSWPSKKLPAKYKPVFSFLRRTLPSRTSKSRIEPTRARALPKGGHTMLVCACVPKNRTVYVKKSMLEVGGVMCKFCGKEFRIDSNS